MDAKTDGSPAPPSDHYDKAKTQPKKNSRRWAPLIVVGVAIIVILALALGLGLGLGLKKHHNHSSTTPVPSNGNSNGTSSEDSNASKEVQSWRRSTEDYSLDMGTWNLNAPPTTRSYNLTVSEMSLAPDGRVKFLKSLIIYSDYLRSQSNCFRNQWPVSRAAHQDEPWRQTVSESDE